MKKLLIISLLAMLCGCGEGLDKYKCQKSVEKMFPNAKVWRVGNGFSFVVEDSLHLYYVETMNMSDANVTDVIKLR